MAFYGHAVDHHGKQCRSILGELFSNLFDSLPHSLFSRLYTDKGNSFVNGARGDNNLPSRWKKKIQKGVKATVRNLVKD